MKVLFACGGTAGHINPAIAVAGRLGELYPGSEFLFVGVEGKMETELVPKEGYEIKTLKMTYIIRGIKPADIKHNIRTIKNVIASVGEAKKIIAEFKPDAVVGTGGYVCYPVLKAAADMKIPTAVHESNAVPGLTTKMLVSKVRKIMVGFEDSVSNYKDSSKVVVTGTPVRGAFAKLTKEEARKQLGISEDRPFVVSVWGSLGASHMNNIVSSMIPMMDGSFDFMHATGKLYYNRVMSSLAENAPDYADKGIAVEQYIYNMPAVMAAADIVMCRAGASTLAELTFMGKPAIIVPSPNVTNNHQEKNARVLERAGGAKVLLEGEFDAAELLDTIKTVLSDKEECDKMADSMRALSVDDATDRICGIIKEIIG